MPYPVLTTDTDATPHARDIRRLSKHHSEDRFAGESARQTIRSVNLMSSAAVPQTLGGAGQYESPDYARPS